VDRLNEAAPPKIPSKENRVELKSEKAPPRSFFQGKLVELKPENAPPRSFFQRKLVELKSEKAPPKVPSGESWWNPPDQKLQLEPTRPEAAT